jgi:hypothetical protein
VYELDHLFVWSAPGGAEADRLATFGLTEGARNVHPGQGTACRRFFFRNAYLEVLWVADPAEARDGPARATGLWPRWAGRGAGASPFGLCLRPAGGGGGPPFSAWEYRPPYLPSPLAISVAEGVPPDEPWWFYVPFGRRPDDPARPDSQPLAHPAGFREVTGVRLHGPWASRPSASAAAVIRAGVADVADAAGHWAEVVFDAGRQGAVEDFRPALPIVFRW